MKFNYPELTTTSHHGRWYDTAKGYYPSITTVLGQTAPPEKVASLENWRNSIGHEEADRISKKATDHGTNVHLLVERFLKGEEVEAPIDGEPVPLADMASFRALKLKLRNIDEVWGQEEALVSDSLEVAGRCDLIGVYKGIPSIIDFKTASRVKSRDDIADYALQLAFYGRAHNEMFETDINKGVILMAADTSMPMEFTFKLEEHIDELMIRVEKFWTAAINSSHD